jgi:hypothetical protein
VQKRKPRPRATGAVIGTSYISSVELARFAGQFRPARNRLGMENIPNF